MKKDDSKRCEYTCPSCGYVSVFCNPVTRYLCAKCNGVIDLSEKEKNIGIAFNDSCDSDCCPLVGAIKSLEDKLNITIKSNKEKISLMAELLDGMAESDSCPLCGNYISEGHDYNCIIRKIETYYLENC